MSNTAGMFTRQFFHGTRADLEPGDLIRVGYPPISRRVNHCRGSTSRAPWMPPSGALSWRLAVSGNGFMSLSQRGQSWMIPT